MLNYIKKSRLFQYFRWTFPCLCDIVGVADGRTKGSMLHKEMEKGRVK